MFNKFKCKIMREIIRNEEFYTQNGKEKVNVIFVNLMDSGRYMCICQHIEWETKDVLFEARELYDNLEQVTNFLKSSSWYLNGNEVEQ